jgi:hypothetical protein
MNRIGRLLFFFALASSAVGCASVDTNRQRDSASERIASMEEQRRNSQSQYRDIPRFLFFYYGWQF